MWTIPVCTASQWLTEGALSAQARTPAKMANTDAARTSRRALILASPNVIHGAVAAHIQVRALATWLAARFGQGPLAPRRRRSLPAAPRVSDGVDGRSLSAGKPTR